MNILKNKLTLIVVVILASLVGLAFVQISWLNKAITTNKQIFVQKVDQATKEVADAYRKSDYLAEKVHHSIDNKSKLTSSLELKNLIETTLVDNNLPLNFTFGFYEHSSSKKYKLVFGNTNVAFLNDVNHKLKTDRMFGWSNLTCQKGYGLKHNYHLAIFPSYNSYIFNEIKYSFGAFFLFVIFILGSFLYLLKIINNQKKISEIKNDFINNLTHEFKTPIFSMSLATKALRKVNNERKTNSYIDVIENENNHLKRQVDKILQLSLLDSGAVQLQEKEVDIHTQLLEVTENLKLIAEEKNANIELKLSAKNHKIIADDTHLKNVWYNLIENAIKYSNLKPLISIETTSNINYFIIKITDNGIGMDIEKQKMIFDKFYRVTTGNIHNTKGFGIGLSYVKSIIDLYKGSIEVKSKLSLGSSFIIKLPIKKV